MHTQVKIVQGRDTFIVAIATMQAFCTAQPLRASGQLGEVERQPWHKGRKVALSQAKAVRAASGRKAHSCTNLASGLK